MTYCLGLIIKIIKKKILSGNIRLCFWLNINSLQINYCYPGEKYLNNKANIVAEIVVLFV